MDHIPFFPERASTIASQIDGIYFMWLALSGVVALAIVVLILYFSIKYHEGSRADRRVIADAATQERRMHRIEIAWIGIPLVLFTGMFAWSAEVFYQGATVPPDALPVYVVGKQWMWHLEHPSGQREIGELHVPIGRPVELVMTSQDVIHSFSIPAFRVKQDVLPGRYTTLWFTATRPGEYHLFCTQYCGTSHSQMVGRVIAMEPAAYASWLSATAGTQTMAGRGAVRFRQFGCSGCHGANATVRAPSLEGLFGKPVPLKDGRSVIADERFIRDSILLPNREVPAGYEATMPSFRGQIGEEELLEIVEYVKSIGNVTQ
jgi:cytochrome c oxidase subunit 2